MTEVKWLSAPKSPDLTRCITLAAMTVTLLLVCYYRLNSTDLRLVLYHRLNSTDHDNRTSSALSAEQRQRQNTTHVLTAYNYSFGLVWPNVDNVDARIMTQIDFTNAYAQVSTETQPHAQTHPACRKLQLRGVGCGPEAVRARPLSNCRLLE